MIKVIFRSAVLLALFVSGFAVSRAIASPDEGKSLVYVESPAAKAAPGTCDRDCLYGFVDRYFNALASRCPCNLPFSPDVKYTENGQEVKLGEGVWKTFARLGTYRVYLADPASGQVVYYGDFSEDSGRLLGVLALRLKIKDHRIVEAEMIADRQQLRPVGGLGQNTAGVMTPKMIDELQPQGFLSPDPALFQPVPAEQRASADQLAATAAKYYEAYSESKGSVAPFSANCVRRENGIAATQNPAGPVVDPAVPAFRLFGGSCAQEVDAGFFSAVAKFRSQRVWIADPEQGLLLTLALFDTEGNVKSVQVPGVGKVTVPQEFLRPITFLEPQLFKIEGGEIREIEGLSWPVPYGMRSGWEK